MTPTRYKIAHYRYPDDEERKQRLRRPVLTNGTAVATNCSRLARFRRGRSSRAVIV